VYISPARLDRVAGRAGIGKRSGFCRRTSRTVTVIAASTRSGLRNEIDFKRLMGSTGDRGDSRRSSFSLQSCLSPIFRRIFPEDGPSQQLHTRCGTTCCIGSTLVQRGRFVQRWPAVPGRRLPDFSNQVDVTAMMYE